MASSGSGQDSIDPVYGPLERDESNATATADAEPPPPPPAPPIDVLQGPVHELPNDGGGSPSQAAAAARKLSSSSGSSPPPTTPAVSVSGGEQSRIPEEANSGRKLRVSWKEPVEEGDVPWPIDLKSVFGDILQELKAIEEEDLAEAEEMERQEEGQVEPPMLSPNRKKSSLVKVKGGMNMVLERTRKQRRHSNRNSTFPSSHVLEEIIDISSICHHYHLLELVAREGKMFSTNALYLHRDYSGFRPVLGDGECFYRSFIFNYLEQVLDRQDTDEERRLLAAVKEVAMLHARLGWNSYKFSKSRKAFKKMIKNVKRWKRHNRWKRVPTNASYRREKLLEFFSGYDTTEHIFAFLRLVAATWICSHQEEYAQRVADLTDVFTLRHWCIEVVIPARIDADHVQMTALATALGVPLRVEDLLQGFRHPIYTGQGSQDRQDHEDGDVPRCTCRPRHSVPADHEVPRVNVLYSRRHYDIIYPHRRVDEGSSSGTGPRPGESSTAPGGSSSS